MKIIDWQIMNYGLNEKLDNGIILYGASGSGNKAIMLLSEIGLNTNILAVVDSDEKKWGSKWLHFEIFNPVKINMFSSDAIIVVTSVYLKEIYQLLNKLQCRQEVCSIFSFRQAIHYDIINNRAYYIKKQLIENYKKKYDLWTDMIAKKPVIQPKLYWDTLKCIMENPVSILICSIQKTGNTSIRLYFQEKHKTNVVFTGHATYFNEYTLKKMKEVLSSFKNHKIKIISGIREPIERIISHKWNKIGKPYYCSDTCISDLVDWQYEDYITDFTSYEELKGKDTELGDYFYADIADWFKDQIENTFDIDVFKYKFDKKKGYSVFQKDNISILVYRLDKLSKLEKEIREFVEDSSFVLKNSNIASEKKYMFAYNEYLNHVKIKKDFFDYLSNSKGMTHFYTKDECKRYKDKWADRLV